MSERTDVCLECWRDFTVDFLHLDCTGEHIVSKEEAEELRAWLIGRYEFIVRSGQVLDEDATVGTEYLTTGPGAPISDAERDYFRSKYE